MARGKKTGGRNWKPGQSGNPNGRPKKGDTLTDLLREYVEGIAVLPVGPEGQKRRVRVKKALIREMVNRALGGSDQIMIHILDRLDGRVVSKLEMTGEDGGPVGLNIIRSITGDTKSGSDSDNDDNGHKS